MCFQNILEPWQDALEACQTLLVTDIMLETTNILDNLLEYGVIKRMKMNELLTEKVSYNRHRSFINFIHDQDEKFFCYFLKVLWQNSMRHLVEKLGSCLHAAWLQRITFENPRCTGTSIAQVRNYLEGLEEQLLNRTHNIAHLHNQTLKRVTDDIKTCWNNIKHENYMLLKLMITSLKQDYENVNFCNYDEFTAMQGICLIPNCCR